MLDHIKVQMNQHGGSWTLSGQPEAPWGHWQSTPAYAKRMKSNPLGKVGDVLGIMQSLGCDVSIY